MRRPIAFLVLGLVGAAVAVAVAAEPTTVVLVRHAEKELTGGDVPLKPEGTERARALVEVVEDAGVTVAIVSKYRRTRMTLAPAIEALGLPPASVLEVTEAKEVAHEILAHHRGETILVAGHSDTVPQILEALGAPSLCPPFEVHPEYGCMLPDGDYHHLFIVTVPTEGSASLVKARYGAPGPM